MTDDTGTGDMEHDMFTPCPGCGNIGFSVMTFEETSDGEIQLMRCPEPFTDCRVAEYYPREVDTDTNRHEEA